MFQKFFDEVELKLQEPNLKKNINFATRNILQQNIFVREKLQTALNQLNLANQKLRDDFVVANPEQKIFYRDDFLNLLYKPCMRLSDTKVFLNYERNKLAKKIITLPRANLMAQNIFVQAELKKNQSKFPAQKIRDFKTIRLDYRKLDKQKSKLSPKDFNDRKKSLEDEFAKLKNLCSSADAQRKIFDITIGILRKNKKFSVKISDLDQKIKNLDLQIEQLRQQMISASSNLPHKFNPKARQAILNRIKNSPSSTQPVSRNFKDVAVNAKITDKDFDMPTKCCKILSQSPLILARR